ncbi:MULTISPECIES: flagellar export chaperone FliS [Enterobacter]|jgi:flagellar protein FliS|uniref:Flagellar secretion chaperone FliS n=2 Tax=Enterobacter cloacae complex TaxID=354276 RepID=A0A2T4Y2R7_ENTCL|nr:MULTISPECIES: flagellar export chaperone FliS [Enterobacter]MCG3099465.1 flagellar export chaperone FliS [Enterobacter sp. DRP3]HEG2001782.1 flagellar export chaperone FliS [Enterobacter asburiae]ELJ8296021.1 flagellar export chaperone FliS [Enterobacter roggenkampii]ELN9580790.1 flagellar export chaperone FliS [Enterobacter roggenkampii]ELS5682091.1 flagellar export chaperone FliS [Enterobacter roggenkampii]
MYTKSGIQAYAQVGVESAVLSASPHQLVVLLFDGALSAMKKAIILIEQGDIPGKGQAISKAINIISNGLQSGLNHEIGGDLAANLDSLYDYMTRRLLQANLHNDINAINEVVELLNNIADAWKEIGPHSQNMRDNY